MGKYFPCSETQFACLSCPLNLLAEGDERDRAAMIVSSVVILAGEELKHPIPADNLIEAAVKVHGAEALTEPIGQAAACALGGLCTVRKSGLSAFERYERSHQ